MTFIPPGPIDHVGIAVRDLDAAAALYTRLLGGTLTGREVVEGQGVEVAFVEVPGSTRIELIAPLDAEGGIARFIDRRGEGMHHICVLVDDLDTTLAQLEAEDVPLVDKRARRGAHGSRIAFLHPAALGGVLLELKEKAT